MFSPPLTRAAARAGVRFVALLALFVAFSAFLSGALRPSDARAQTPGGAPDVLVEVATDRPGYAPGDPVRVTVTVRNLSEQRRLLEFPSTLVADYAIDGRWRWSDGRAFATVITTIPLGPKDTWTFPTFIHRPADYVLPAGRHEITGIVPGYGRATTVITIGDENAPPPGLLLTPEVTPNPAPFGARIALAVTVTNVSDRPMSFGHDGCPVRFTVDGWWTPPVACAEYWRTVDLGPGESIRFGPPEFGYLELGRPESDFLLDPGTHVIDFEVPGVGRTAARVRVEGGGGSISGLVMGADGALRPGAVVQAYLYAPTDSAKAPPNSGHAIFQTMTDREGNYRFDHLPAGLYYLNASYHGSAPVWYPGVANRDEATPIAVAEGADVEEIDFLLGSGEPPPPPPGVIVARVFEALPPGSAACCPRPLVDAVVAAVPVFGVRGDSGSVPPGDSTGWGSDPATGTGGGDTLPPWPDDRLAKPAWYGFADSLGQVLIHAPYGTYRLVAFTQSHRYQWWDMTSRWEESRLFDLTPTRELKPEVRFDLEPFEANVAPLARVTGQISGYVGGGHGEPPVPPIDSTRVLEHPDVLVPVDGAEVVARPLVQDPRIAWFAPLLYSAVTDADGRYDVDVPANVPYLVQAWARGWQPRYYDGAASEWDARPVDVAPGATTPGIDLVLPQTTSPGERGTITGVVYREAGRDALGQRLIHPAGGALVRVRTATPGGGPALRVVRAAEDGTFFVDGLPMTADGSLRYLVSADDEFGIPTYFPEAHRWQEATPVAPALPVQTTPIRLVLHDPATTGPHFVVGLVRAGFGSGDQPVDTTPPPFDEPIGESSVWPLIGAYLYLVPADDPEAGPVAAGVACDNGTLLVHRLPAGRYKAYADHPGFATGWYLGTSRADAAVLTVGDGGATPLIDIVLEPVGSEPTPGGESDLAEPRMLTELRNTPNPFRPQTTIVYRLMAPAPVTVQVFDLNGRLVRTLAESARQSAGEQRLPWDGRDDSGQLSSAGIYFFRVWTPVETRTGKMVMVR
jgi:hypothetical protein